jgi:hypothetical protein
MIEEAKPHPLTHRELQLPVVTIVEHLVVSLRLVQPLVDIQKKFVALQHLRRDNWEPSLTWRVWAHHRGISAVHHLEWRGSQP